MGERAAGKRVRTGCLTCRGRRRKCDEEKPECAHCKSKGLTCRYNAAKLTFVMSKFQDEQGHAAARPRQSREATQLDSSEDVPSFQIIPEFPPSPGIALATPGLFSPPLTAGVDLTSDAQTRSINATVTAPLPQRQWHGHPHSLAYERRNLGRRFYELELLTFYRYEVAPILDLGIGSLCFGVHCLILSQTSEAVYHAILAVASSQRASVHIATAQVDQATSTISTHLVRGSTAVKHSALAPQEVLFLWRDICLTPVDQWFTMSYRVQDSTHSSTRGLEEWLLLSRLHSAVSLVALPESTGAGTFPSPPQTTADEKFQPALLQLAESLWLLVKTFTLLVPDKLSSNSPGFVVTPDWHAHWQLLQQWHSRRSDEMRQIFELADDDVAHFDQHDSFEFPHIIFSNACATVANVAHHVASLTLLQNKPRLTKLSAKSNSSTSSLWHAHRATGIVSAAADAEIWDPFMTAALMYCTRKLSNGKQICFVANTMKRIQNLSGLKLEKVIGNLEQLAMQT